jgi:hypothetical protein
MAETKQKTIHEKLLQVQTELKAPKNRRNTFGKYNYRSCEDILEAVKPILAKAKATIFLDDTIYVNEGRYYVQATAYFADAEHPDVPYICVSALAREPQDKKGMDEPQITGTASSYARKYALNGLLLIDDVKDPDSDEYREESEQKAKNTKRSDTSALDAFVNAEQIATLNMLLKKAEVTEAKFCSIYNVAVVPEFPASKYDEAVRKLEAAIKAKKGDK